MKSKFKWGVFRGKWVSTPNFTEFTQTVVIAWISSGFPENFFFLDFFWRIHQELVVGEPGPPRNVAKGYIWIGFINILTVVSFAALFPAVALHSPASSDFPCRVPICARSIACVIYCDFDEIWKDSLGNASLVFIGALVVHLFQHLQQNAFSLASLFIRMWVVLWILILQHNC